ncbi:MAG: hypothetical protein KGL39_30225 [Patescibacteria group bacterium]|nr:hypothetical protein [Patescibacteria group bacterium]
MSSNAFHDGNHTPTLLVVQNDGATLINIKADPTLHTLNISDGTSGSDNGPSTSRHDASHVPVLMAVSSVDGKTPIVVYGDSSGNLLTDSF